MSAVAAASTLVVVIAIAVGGCGKKGPPLPPLLKIPAAPTLKAARRGDTVDLQLTVPNTNTDGTRPANIERVDVYGFTGPATLPDADLVKRGTKVASVSVKSPRDPDETVDAGEPRDDLDPLTGDGLDQGAVTHVEEDVRAVSEGGEAVIRDGRPLLGPIGAGSSRIYVGVGVNNKGRLGRFSSRVAVPLLRPPPAPSSPVVSYTETAIAVTWNPGAAPGNTGSTDVLPSRPIGLQSGAAGYNVYDVGPAGTAVLLTPMPLTTPRFADSRIEWGAERCYAVRAVQMVGTLAVESDAQPPTCARLVDTFPPAPPKALRGIATDGAVNLIWEANTEKDLAGYIVLRATPPSDRLEPVTAAPIADVIFTDKVQPGTRYVYAIKAVDKAGNQSEPSNREEVTAR
jgi:hypothetical protein